MRAGVLLLPLLLLSVGAGPIRCGDDPLPALEAEKADFLARTVPKADFWSAVEKKGELVKQEKEILAAAPPIEQKKVALEAEIAAAEAELSAAQVQRKQAEAALEQARGELARARADQDAREARLRGFAARRAAEGVDS